MGFIEICPEHSMMASSMRNDDTATGARQEGARPAPSRLGADLKASRQMASCLRLLVKGDPEPDQQAWATMGQALWQGDPLADDLVAWMHEFGMARAWPLFERALTAPRDLNDSTPAPLRQFVCRTAGWPDWVREDLMVEGAQALRSTGLHGMMVLRDAGLMAGYQASAINQTLVMTGSLHKGAQRRVAETTSWWLACTEEGGMAPGGAGFMMTLRVRVMHALVRHQLGHSPKWDAASLGVPVNQLDMQATYLAFSVVQLLSLKTTGVWLSRRESEAVMHLWRYIGWLMGVDEGYLCDDEQQGRTLLYQNVLSQAPADETSVLLGQALMDEPLQRLYPNLAGLRGRFNKARHLSLVRWFVGPKGMRALGLPATLPWYPLLVMGPFLLRSLVLHAVPGLMPVWRRWVGQRQRDYLKVLMGAHGSPHLTGGAHPAKRQAG